MDCDANRDQGPGARGWYSRTRAHVLTPGATAGLRTLVDCQCNPDGCHCWLAQPCCLGTAGQASSGTQQNQVDSPQARSASKGWSAIRPSLALRASVPALPPVRLRALRISVVNSVPRALRAFVVKTPCRTSRLRSEARLGVVSGQWSVVSDGEGWPLCPSLITNHQPPATLPPPRRAFTLTELLVVIAIMAVLAALASVAVVRGLDTAKQTRMKVEVDALDAAFKAYKEKYGSYPPCDLRWANNSAAIKQHIAKAFPRYKISNLQIDLAKAVDTSTFRPDQALVFWLSGFGPDVTNPFLTPDDAQITNGIVPSGIKVARSALFDFDKSRRFQFQTPGTASGTTTLHSYFPQGVKTDGTQGPYVYFDSSFYGPPPKQVGMFIQPAWPNAFNYSNSAVNTPGVSRAC